MTHTEALKQLKALGNKKVRAQNAKHGAGDKQFRVPLVDIRTLAWKIRTNHELARSLWARVNVGAQFLAALQAKPGSLSAAEMDGMVRSISFVRVADWLNSHVVRQYPEKEALRQKWMADEACWAARAGLDLTAERVAKSPDGVDLPALLSRIESEMAAAEPEIQWTMNNTLATIGIHHPTLRKRAIAIGEKLGFYRDYPVSKARTASDTRPSSCSRGRHPGNRSRRAAVSGSALTSRLTTRAWQRSSWFQPRLEKIRSCWIGHDAAKPGQRRWLLIGRRRVRRVFGARRGRNSGHPDPLGPGAFRPRSSPPLPQAHPRLC